MSQGEGPEAVQAKAAEHARAMRALERSLAFDMAEATLRTTAAQRFAGAAFWNDTGAVMPADEPDLEQAVQYLEWRGLLERHPENPDWVQVREESEATDGEGPR